MMWMPLSSLCIASIAVFSKGVALAYVLKSDGNYSLEEAAYVLESDILVHLDGGRFSLYTLMHNHFWWNFNISHASSCERAFILKSL